MTPPQHQAVNLARSRRDSRRDSPARSRRNSPARSRPGSPACSRRGSPARSRQDSRRTVRARYRFHLQLRGLRFQSTDHQRCRRRGHQCLNHQSNLQAYPARSL